MNVVFLHKVTKKMIIRASTIINNVYRAFFFSLFIF